MKTKGSKRIPDNTREQVKILAIEGLSERTIANKLNISNNAVHRIKKEVDNLEQLRADKKRKMANSLWDLAIEMKEQITKKKLKESSAAKLVISLATLIDKALLLVGEVTDRFEFRTEAEIDQQLKELEQAERELQKAWDWAQKQWKKAAEEPRTRIYQRSQMRRLTPIIAIRKYCIQCSGSQKAPRHCINKECTLFAFRLGKNPKRVGIGGRRKFERFRQLELGKSS